MIVKLSLLEKVVSPPHKSILNLFCSDLSEFKILFKLFFVNVFLLP